jgi:ubiquinone/menaquinone biosynthesis C-methylase UbiE
MFTTVHTYDRADAGVKTDGQLLDWGWRYDLMTSVIDFVLLGKLGRLRQQTLDFAQVQRGDAVLEVGCGTGALSLDAYRRVGPSGLVAGIDPAPRQIARARANAARQVWPIDFRLAAIEQLPFVDAAFDAVLSTFMLHHLPGDLKLRGLQEVARVLRPGGRLVVLDAQHPRHDVPHQDVPGLLRQIGFDVERTHDVRLAPISVPFQTAAFAVGLKSRSTVMATDEPA